MDLTKNIVGLVSAAILTDLIVIGEVLAGIIKSKSLKQWYNLYGLAAVMADVLSLVIGVLIAATLYPLLFSKYNVVYFIGLAVLVQFVHDILFALFFQGVPRGKSRILDTFKDYAKENGYTILLADAAMIVSTILISTFLQGYSHSVNNAVLVVLLYLVPYFLYSI